MHDAGWYFRRLRAMEARELVWRSKATVRNRLPSHRFASDAAPLSQSKADWKSTLELFRRGASRPILLDRTYAQQILESHPDHVSQLVSVANKAVHLSFQFPGYPEASLGSPANWNYEPIGGFSYPTLRSNRMNYQTLPGEAAWMLRVHRLQHLPWLAQAWLFTGDDRYCGAALGQLESWIDQNPPGRGIAWHGALEAALRAIAVTVALQGFRDAPQLTPDRFRRIVEMLAESARRCWNDRSRYSSANNHLVGEMAGLATVGIMFPELLGAKEWESDALRILTEEAPKQILDDGMSAEQSVAYQMFTVELLHLVAALLVGRDGSAPAPLLDAVYRSSALLGALIADGNPAPRYGDDDEGFALRMGVQQARTLSDHLGIVASPGRSSSSSLAAGNVSLDSMWFRALTAHVSESSSAQVTVEADVAEPQTFAAYDGGLVVLRSQKRRITMDIGPLGYLSIAAHGHADALAITLSEDGKDLIGDPGTGSYYGHPGWRTVMRGTRAHSTVCVDSEDQSLVGGSYLWLRHAEVEVLGLNLAAGIVDARHNGYMRLRGGVMHRRWLIAPPDERWQLIVDRITGKGEHSCEQNWPLHPSLDAETLSASHVVSRDGTRILRFNYATSSPVVISATRGDVENNIGWWSDPAEGRSPAWWLNAKCISAELPVAMAALITPESSSPVQKLCVSVVGNQIRATWTEDDVARSVAIDIAKSASIVVEDSL